MAGGKDGIGGSKSGLVDEMFRLIASAQVPTLVLENVYFMLQLNRGWAMHALVARLEALGYMWAYRVVDTQAFGLPQRRRRVYLVASTELDPRHVLLGEDAAPDPSPSPTLARPLGFYWTEGRSGVGFAVDAIPPLKGGSGLGIASAPAVLFTDGAVLTPGTSACERLQGFPSGWTAAATSVGRNPEGRLLGNAVSVPAARWVARRLKSPSLTVIGETSPLDARRSWPDAAYNVGTGRQRAHVSAWPISVTAPSINQFRDSSWRPLSPRALGGFVRRAKEGRLRFPSGFLDGLEVALATPSELAA